MSGVENACNNISFVVSCRVVSCVLCRVSCVVCRPRWSIAAQDQVANIRGRETLETEARSLRPPRVVFPAQNLGRIGSQEPRCAWDGLVASSYGHGRLGPGPARLEKSGAGVGGEAR